MIDLKQRHLLTQARFVFAKGIHSPTNGGNMLAKIQIQAVTVGGRIASPTAVPDRSVPVSVHSAPQYPDACHAHLSGDSPCSPAFSHCGNVHGALAGSHSANPGGSH
jgi:hypothetical protein